MAKAGRPDPANKKEFMAWVRSQKKEVKKK
jgi:hypothetical protein